MGANDKLAATFHPHSPAAAPRVTDTYICEDCGTGWNSEPACERCDCGAEDRYYSPSRSRVSYLLGDD